MKTLVIGLGNPILTDDGVGVLVAYALMQAIKGQDVSGIEITEASVGGLRLMEMMIGYERVIVIDGSREENDLGPGTIRRFTLADLSAISPLQHTASAHDTSLVTALQSGRRMGLPLPKEIILFGVGVQNVFDFGEHPTPAVAAAVPLVCQAVLQELGLAPSRSPLYPHEVSL